MNPRTFYRSRAFWFGLPGLVFLLWAWWFSTGHYSAAGFEGTRPWAIGQMGGEVYGIWNPDGGPMWGNLGGVHSEKMSGQHARELKKLWAATSEGDRSVFIPYYWLVLAYTATWLLTLALWQRRRARVLKLHAAP